MQFVTFVEQVIMKKGNGVLSETIQEKYKSMQEGQIPYRGKFSSGKNLVTSEQLVSFPRLIFQIRHFSPTNF